MRSGYTLLVTLAVVSLLMSLNNDRHRSIPVDLYPEFEVDGIRLGMSLKEVETIWGDLQLGSVVEFFGETHTLFVRKGERSFFPGFVIVNDEKIVVQIEGFELKRNGELSDLTFLDDAEPEVTGYLCRATDIWTANHKYFYSVPPLGVRGPNCPRVFLGNDPPGFDLCYRADNVGVCLEGLHHVSPLIPAAKNRLDRYAQNLDELPEYPKDGFLVDLLVCPLGGTYRLAGPTLTCEAHPEGPISVTCRGRKWTFAGPISVR